MTAAEFLDWTRDHATRGNAADEAAVAFAVEHHGEIPAEDAVDMEALDHSMPVGFCRAASPEGMWRCTRRRDHSRHHVASDSYRICHRWPR